MRIVKGCRNNARDKRHNGPSCGSHLNGGMVIDYACLYWRNSKRRMLTRRYFFLCIAKGEKAIMHTQTLTTLQRWGFRGVVCLTGPHGIGKSYTVHTYCAEQGKTIVDVMRERERHDVKWDRIPLMYTKKTVCLLDAPFLSAGDGGMASLKRFMSTCKVPVICLLDPSMCSAFGDVCKTFGCLHVTYDSYPVFKERAKALCMPTTPHEVALFEHCVRSARRNIAFVLNNYRFMCRDGVHGVASCGTYDAARPTATEALSDLLIAPRPMRSIEDNVAMCIKQGVDIDHALASIASAFAPEAELSRVCTVHTLASDAALLLGREDSVRLGMCTLTRRAIAGVPATSADALLRCTFRPKSTRVFAPAASRKRPRSAPSLY